MFGRTDLAAAGLAVTSLLLVAVECLSSYFMSGIKSFVPCPQPFSCLHKISHICSVCLAWYMLAFVTVSFLYLAKTRRNKHIQETQHYRTVSNCFYNIWAFTLGVSVTEQPVSDKLSLSELSLFLCRHHCFSNFFASVLVGPGMKEQIS